MKCIKKTKVRNKASKPQCKYYPRMSTNQCTKLGLIIVVYFNLEAQIEDKIINFMPVAATKLNSYFKLFCVK